LRCGGIFSYSTITNFIMILTVKRSESWSIFDEVIRRTQITCQFWATLYVLHLCIIIYSLAFNRSPYVRMLQAVHQFASTENGVRFFSQGEILSSLLLH